MANVTVLDHPLIQHKLAILRSKDTPVKEFRELVGEIAGLMCYEATRNLPLKEVRVETPITTATCHMLAGKKMAIVPILRAGLGMVDSMVGLIPSAKIGHIGLYRDPETHKPVEYYCKLPDDIGNRQVFVVDPMLATGGSAIAAIDFLKQHGCKQIIMMNIIGCPEGVKAVTAAHPDVDIYLAAMDEKLNANAYIVPGLGDAGDRIFVTKGYKTVGSGNRLTPHILYALRHFQIQLLAAEDVEMQVLHGLARVAAAVADHPVAACQTLGLGDSRNDLKDVGHHRTVFGADTVTVGDVDLGHHQNVGRRLGVDIPEGEDGVVLVDLGRGNFPRDDFTEQTIRHFSLPPD